jgi:hypothetical protein
MGHLLLLEVTKSTVCYVQYSRVLIKNTKYHAAIYKTLTIEIMLVTFCLEIPVLQVQRTSSQ